MAGYEPTPRDKDKHVLHGHGTGTITYRWTSVDGTNGQDISFPIDVKSCLIHIEGNLEIFNVTGSDSNSTAAYFTSDGVTLEEINIAVAADETICTIKAPSGETINVSAIGWR